VIAFIRRPESGDDFILVCCNFTPVARANYRLGVPDAAFYEEILNTDSVAYGGSNTGNGGAISSDPVPSHGRSYSISVTLPPLGLIVLRKR
jgi:1,4-alpha-glucan branching enzyme